MTIAVFEAPLHTTYYFTAALFKRILYNAVHRSPLNMFYLDAESRIQVDSVKKLPQLALHTLREE